ncbi:MAG: UvrD-helicase domain-containing protein [Polyangiaceae bacterium]
MDDAGTIYAFRRNLVLAASAGTGKTHSLVGVLVHLLVGASELGGGPHEPVDPGCVLATTFSRKAAAEIRARVVDELEKLASDDPTAKYRADLDASHDRAGRPRWTADETARRARDALVKVGRAQIGTLHSFASSLLRTYALETGLSPSFDLADEETTRTRVEEGIARAIESVAAVDTGPLERLVAAAGGVDRLVMQLAGTLARLEEDGRGASSLVVHETDARAIESQMRDVLDHARALERFPRFDAPASMLLRAWDSNDASVLGPAMEAFVGVRASPKDGPEARAWVEFRDVVLPGKTHGERARNLVTRWRLRGEFAASARFARDLLVASEREIRGLTERASSLSYGDLLRAARDLLRDRPDIAAEMGASLDVALIDELQDTSRLQRDLILLLWERDPRARAPGALARIGDVRGEGLLVVGDRKQSIYAFRGADVSVFAEVCVGLAGAPARRALGIEAGRTWEPEEPRADFVPLRHNRRGEPELLSFANELSAQRFRPGEPPELYEIAYVPSTEDLLPPPERPYAGEPTPRTTWLRVPLAERQRASSPSDEASVIAARVRAMVEAASAPNATLRWRDVAVLAETNRMLDHVAYAMACAGVPYVVAGSGFYAAREVRDLAAMLALLIDPGEAWAILEVLRGPWGGVRDETLIALTDPHTGLARLGPAWDRGARRAAIHPDDRETLDRIRRVVEPLHRDLDRLGSGAALREAVRALDLEAVLVQLPRGPQRVANVRKLLSIADSRRDPRALLERLDDAADREVAEGEAATFSDEDDAVRLLTVHASKGLDFPVVFLPEVGKDARRVEREAIRLDVGTGDEQPSIVGRIVDEDGQVYDGPSYDRAIEDARRRDRAERQRLAYVASTRASRAMFFVGDRAQPHAGETDAYSATTAAALRAIADSPERRGRAMLDVEEAIPVPPTRLAPEDSAREKETDWVSLERPSWRSLPIATTALQDFDHCPRRFQLAHVLDLPERTVALDGRDEAAAREAIPRLDARAEGALVHRVLEQVDVASFGAPLLARAETSRILERAGISSGHARHGVLLERVLAFLGGAYASRVAAQKGEIAREVPFVLDLQDAEKRAVTLRGTIDLLVRWRDGSVDVLDYKRARDASVAAHALQLDAYVLAARALSSEEGGPPAEPRRAVKIRAGIVFLGAEGGEPVWREGGDARDVDARLASLAARVVEARWTERFPRAPIATCRSIRCGYVAVCHPEGAGQPRVKPTAASRA